MKFQRTTWKCGVYALMNALRCFGTKVSEKRIMAHTSTNKNDGTSEFGILNGILRLGFDQKEIKATSQEEAWAELVASIEVGNPVIINTENARHWVTVIGLIGDSVIVFDSDVILDAENKKENGTRVFDYVKLFKWWNKVDGHYYGISVKEI